MASCKLLITALVLVIVFQSEVDCGATSQSSENLVKSAEPSIPVLPSDKRQHNIMRFGKRPSEDNQANTLKQPQHSFLYFGKRAEDQIPDILKYIQKNRDNSYKRGHTIMRFGKRGGENHNFIRFGKRDDDYGDYADIDDEYDTQDIDEEKKNGHAMMSFGKRGNGHAMMSFGKRGNGHSMMSFGKRGNGHSMMSFGKRVGGHSIMSFGKRGTGHSMLSFGKRGTGHSMLSFGKRGTGHSMMSFGKREPGHSMMSFGKRDLIEDKRGMYDTKRPHTMIHFGKRDYDEDLDEDKLGFDHSMIRFGKRDSDPEDLANYYWYPEDKREPSQQHHILRFGKKDDGGSRQSGSHAMIHFGKRDDDKRAHAMIHFGKRSVDEIDDNITKIHDEASSSNLNRIKRESGSDDPLMAVVRYDSSEDVEVPSPDGGMLNGVIMERDSFFNPGETLNSLEEPDVDDGLISSYVEDSEPDKKNDSKNMFLRFG